MTEETVTTEQVSTTEPVSMEGVTPTPAPLTEERIQQMIVEATARAVGEAKEAGRRELQSEQDRNKAELARVERRARVAEGRLGAAQQSYKDLDPEVAKELELADLRERDRQRNAGEQEEATRRQQEVFTQALHSSLLAHLEALGIDSKDKRIDWAEDSNDYVQGRGRFDASVAKIIKEEQQATKGGLEKRLKELEAKIEGVSVEANSVDTGASQGVAVGSDAEFMGKFASGELPMTKANVDRYEKITKTYK